jgi:hypothetical protein
MPNTTLNRSQGGIVGDHGHIEGGVHFYPSAPAGPPLQRPARADYFTGREGVLARLLEALRPGAVVTLCGPGGIGKSALAAEAVWALAPGDEAPARFPDGILFHSFYGQPDSALAFEHIATSFGADPKPSPASAALQVLAGKRALLILDGARASLRTTTSRLRRPRGRGLGAFLLSTSGRFLVASVPAAACGPRSSCSVAACHSALHQA